MIKISMQFYGGRGAEHNVANRKTRLNKIKVKKGKDTPSGKDLEDFRNMSDDEREKFMDEVYNTQLPDGINQRSNFQRLTYMLGMNDKPEVVSEEEFEKRAKAARGKIIWHTTNDVVNEQGEITKSAEQIHSDFMNRDLQYQGNGTTADGTGFANKKDHSARIYGDEGHAVTFKAILNSKAKTIKSRTLIERYRAYMKDNPTATRTFEKAAGQSYHRTALAQFALMQGYNVILKDMRHGDKYTYVLDRSVLTMTPEYEKH